MIRLLYFLLVIVLVSCSPSASTPSALKTISDSDCYHLTNVHRPVFIFDRVLAPGVIHALFDIYLSDAMSDSNEHRRLADYKINSVDVQPVEIVDPFVCAVAEGAKSISIVDFSVKPFLQGDSEWVTGYSEISDEWVNHILVYVDVLEENEEYYLVFLDPDS